MGGEEVRDYIKILKNVKENAIDKYEELKSRTNDDQGPEMIVFTSRTIYSGHVNDIRDEDTDEYIGITKDGWVIYTHDIEYFGGPIKIKNEQTVNVGEQSVIDLLEKYDDDEYLRFMEHVCKLYKRY